MKRWFRSIVPVVVLALVLVMAYGLVANAAPTTVEFWHYWEGNNGKVIDELVAKYNKEHPQAQVKAVFVPGGELLAKLQAAITGKQPPAVAAGDVAWMAKLLRSGALAPLDGYLAKAKVDIKDFYPSLLEYDRFDRKTFALPVSTNNLGLFYNKDLFKKAGLDPEKPPTNWDELREYAKKLTKPDGSQYGFEIFTQAGDSGEGLTWQLQPYLWQAGADFLTDNYQKPGFNNAKGEKALQFLVDLLQKDKAAGVGKWGAFGKGQAGMVVDGSWMVGIWRDNAPFDFGTGMIPYPKDGKPGTNLGGEHAFVFKTTPEKQQAAADFIIWLTSTAVQVNWDMQTGFMPVRKSVASNAGYRKWLQEKEPRLIPFVEQQQYAHARPPVPQYPDASLAFAREIERAYYGKVGVKEALANAAKAVSEVLEKK